jgi:type IV pilus assembly protein PilB
VEAARNPWPALGALLVRDGVVTPAELELALSEKRRRPELRLGEILIENGYATPAAVSRALAEQHDLEFIDLDVMSIDHAAAGLLPHGLAARYLALPIRLLEDGSVLVAVSDPTNVMFSDELRLALGMPIRVCVAAPDVIEYAIAKVNNEAAVLINEVESTAADNPDDATVIDLEHDAPAVVFINRAIAKALDLGASDVHFMPQERRLIVRARVDGVMREIGSIAGSHGPVLATRLKIMADLDIAERRAAQDGRVSIRRGGDAYDVRIAIVPTTFGESATLRLLSQGQAPASLQSLGMFPRSREALERAVARPFGAVIVAGPTGSGKTTTVHTCLKLLNTPERKLTTIEDPVEYRTEGIDQIEVNPRAGLTFASGLRTVLRSDPDVILVGEIRDEETAQIAFRAAMTGHTVLTTLHTQSAAAAIQRLADMDIERSILATSVNCIVSQRLARRLCQACCERMSVDSATVAALQVPETYGEVETYSAVGCRECDGTGYKGRIPLFEVMTMTDEVAGMIGAPTREIEAVAVAQGMFTLREDGIRLAVAGITTLDEVRRVAGDALA